MEVKDNVMKFAQKNLNNMKEFSKEKVLPTIKKSTESTKKAVTKVSNKAIEKVKTSITEE